MGPAEAEPQLPTIYIHVPLNGETNKYVNFARLAEERYGWAALNPKLAKSKLGLHMDSGDEMMMDDSASDSNTDTNKTAQPDPNQPRKRQKRTYQDVYDKNDPFIDDSEMMWEEQAAASKDGFFVYSGPLVPEGSKPQIERYVFALMVIRTRTDYLQGGWNHEAWSWSWSRRSRRCFESRLWCYCSQTARHQETKRDHGPRKGGA